MVTARTLLIFNFGTCALFLLIGFLSTYVIQALLPGLGHPVILSTLSQEARQSLAASQDLESMRAQALFLFDLTRSLKDVQATTEIQQMESFKFASYLIGAIMALGGLLTIAMQQAFLRGAKSDGSRLAC